MSLSDDLLIAEVADAAAKIRSTGLGFCGAAYDPGIQVDPRDAILAGQVAEMLTKHYPGHPWAVTADHKGGVIVIKNLGFSFTYGYVLKIADDDGPRLHVEIMRAGGEILERFRVPRARAQEEDYRDKIPQMIKPDL